MPVFLLTGLLTNRLKPMLRCHRQLMICLVAALALSGRNATAGFNDMTTVSGIVDFERIDRLGLPDFLERGGSIIVMDFDQDGWLDLYITRYGMDDILFRNNEGSFERIDNPLGLETNNGGNASVWADFDNDGDKDMIVAVADEKRHLMYVNEGGGSFVEAGVERGVALPSTNDHQGSSVAFGDINRDGYLDVIIGEWGADVDDSNRFQHYGLFLNDGESNPGHFTNITQSSNFLFLGSSINFYAPCITDLDSDGWPDLATVVDFGGSAIFWNNGDNTFENTTGVSQVGVERHGMGSAIGDVNADGLLDWYVTTIAMAFTPLDAEANQLYINQGGRLFENASVEAGVSQGGWGWGTNFFDHDNDGDLDIVMVNAENTLQKEEYRITETAPMILWQNEGDLVFQDVSDSQGVNRIGSGAGIVNFDYDNDGDLDLFAVHEDSPPVLLRNNLTPGLRDWLRLSFDGVVSNRDGIGVKVALQAEEGGPMQYAEFNPSNGYLAQLEPFLHFGLGSGLDSIHRITLTWPSSIVQELDGISVNQVLHVVEDASLLQGSTKPVFDAQPQEQVVAPGESIQLTVSIEGGFQPSILWYRNGQLLAGEEGPSLSIDSASPLDAGVYHATATNDSGSTLSEFATVAIRTPFPGKSVARQWNEALLDAIRINFPDPPIVSRNLYHASAATWDAFWTYEENGWGHVQPAFHKEIIDASDWGEDRLAAQKEAISFAVFRVVEKRYQGAFNSDAIIFAFRDLMHSLGYDPDNRETEGSTPPAVGNRIGNAILEITEDDGSNEANGYADTGGYAPINDPLIYGTSGVALNDPNRWQPLSLTQSVTKNGIDLGEETQNFLTPFWNRVTPFALLKPTPTTIAIDPGPQPLFGTETEESYIAESLEVIRASSLLDPDEEVFIDTSPGSMQNNPFGTQDGTGRDINPYTGEAYSPNLVNRADYWRVTAEFWSDGPGVEGPPGVWNMLHNQVVDDPRFERRFAGAGPLLTPLEWDTHAYLAINGALHDAAIAAWTVKAKYDSIRPISMIRYLAALGQSSDPGLPSYHPSGLPLESGLVELITEESVAEGQRHEGLSDYIDEIALRVWKGVPSNPESETSGVGWIRGADWTPYHLRTFPTPNFAGYVSGHSTFARAGAEVMALLTGTPYFPGGLKEIPIGKGEGLQVEYGPKDDLVIQCATYYDAADLTGVARIYCGVHIAADDFVGREMGARAGIDAFLKLNAMRSGDSDIGYMDTPTVRFAPKGATTPLVAFQYGDGFARPLRIARTSDRDEAMSSSDEMMFVVNHDDDSHPEVEFLSANRPVRRISVSGPLDPEHPLAIRFDVATEEPVFLLAQAEVRSDEGPLTLIQIFTDDTGGSSLIDENQYWLAGDKASQAFVFSERDPAAPGLGDRSSAIPLNLSKGSYRLVCDASGFADWAQLTLSIVE